jgi:hypothetical protein
VGKGEGLERREGASVGDGVEEEGVESEDEEGVADVAEEFFAGMGGGYVEHFDSISRHGN